MIRKGRIIYLFSRFFLVILIHLAVYLRRLYKVIGSRGKFSLPFGRQCDMQMGFQTSLGSLISLNVIL